ncbi:MAG: RCC1 repeat- and reductase domain-containing protein [Actinomycetota bacterium]|nr:RCC1 repeat- and reductase domain-containing protein [Actinomycetota bacterium]
MLFCSTTLALLAGGVPPAVASHPGPWGFGLNDVGQVGDGTPIVTPAEEEIVTPAFNPYPTTIVGSHTFTKVAGGGSHSLGLKLDGTVWAWGLNSSGQLGNGTTTASSTPVKVTGLIAITDISAGGAHSAAVDITGKVHAWGSNSFGQLGDGSTDNSLTPVRVEAVGGGDGTTLEGVTKVAAGANHTLALNLKRTVYAWGSNSFGQLGDETTTDRTTPVVVSVISNVKAISAGSHSLAITDGVASGSTDDPVYAWGQNNRGQLGIAADLDPHPKPEKVPGMPLGATQVAAASAAGFSLALKGGEVFSWGANFAGQLGHGNRVTGNKTGDPDCLCDHKPNRVKTSIDKALSGITGIAAGYFHALAIQSVGTATTNVVAWGNNQYGQLGNGKDDVFGEGPEDCNGFNCSWFAIKVKDSSSSSDDLANVSTIAAGSNHSLAG